MLGGSQIKNKNMKKYINPKVLSFIVFILGACLIFGCKEDVGITENKIGAKPNPVSNPKVEPISGGAYITYDLPLSEDLRYVKATYTLDNGIVREAKASIYKNKLLVNGFGKEGEYTIELRAVAVGEVESDPITVKVAVLKPPFALVLDKLKEGGNNLKAAFGGINVQYFNETKADLIIRILIKDSVGVWQKLHTEYTDKETDIVRIRGLANRPTDFRLLVEDQFDHVSDTLNVNLTPLKEIFIPKDKWKAFPLANDGIRRQDDGGAKYAVEKIWDDNKTSGGLNYWSYLSDFNPLPFSVTAIDLGQPVVLTRAVMLAHNSGSGLYGGTHIYDFALYGSNNPTTSGNWNEWTLIERFKGVRIDPSREGQSASSAEKNQLLEYGETFEISDPDAHEKFRYIRIRVFATWETKAYDGEGRAYLNELFLYGQF